MDFLLAVVVVVVVMMGLDFNYGYCKPGQIRKRSIRSNALTRVEQSESVLDLDWRYLLEDRESAMNASQIREVLDAHNTRRRWEKAADMEILSWNNILASMAEDWAEKCLWKHGQTPRGPGTVPYNWVGQNLYAVSGFSSVTLTSAIHNWYEEKSFYDYDTRGCQAGKMCGHYTQVVWSNSREVGCAYARCPKLPPLAMTNALYLVCNYGPGGNYNQKKPYQNGTPCTKCESGFLWCNQGLCDGSCVQAGPKCGCSPICLNGGTANRKTCSCSCPPGWYEPDCSVVCEDHSPKCNPPRGGGGWPVSWCNHQVHGDMVQENCPAMCNICQQTSK